MSEIGNLIKKLTLEELSKQGSVSLNRIGHVGIVNSDGTAMVLIDGQGFTAELLYPAVKGQEVLIMPDSSGGFRAMPTRPNPAPVVFDQPHFFAGGNLKFAKGQFLQQAFDPNLYKILAPDLVGYSSKGFAFSPDGARYVIIFVKPGTMDVRFRVYSIGSSLTAGPLIDPAFPLYELKVTLLFEITRSMDWQDLHGIPSSSGVSTDNNLGGNSSCWAVALDKDPTQLYWGEHETVPIAGPPPIGAPIEIVHVFKLNGLAPVQMGQWTVRFSGAIGGGHGSERSPFFIDTTGQGFGFVSTQPTGFWDAKSAEMTGAYTAPFASGGFLLSGTTIGAPTTAIVTPSGLSVPVAAYPPFGYPSAILTNAPNIISVISSRGSNTSHSRQQQFNSGIFNDPSEDFIRVFYEDTGTLEKHSGVFTNSVSTDLINVGKFLMTSKAGGLYIDFFYHVRRVSSTDGGSTFTADPDPANYLKITPGQLDPTVIWPDIQGRTIAAVSTL